MQKINYIFYRLYKHYNKENPIFTAAIYITMFEILIIYFVFMMFNAVFYPERRFGEELSLKYHVHDNGKLFALTLYFILHLINYLIYRKKVEQYEIRFANHPMNKWFKLWMLYFLGLFLFFFPILVFKIRQYFL